MTVSLELVRTSLLWCDSSSPKANGVPCHLACDERHVAAIGMNRRFDGSAHGIPEATARTVGYHRPFGGGFGFGTPVVS